jgi:hypothetical protein
MVVMLVGIGKTDVEPRLALQDDFVEADCADVKPNKMARAASEKRKEVSDFILRFQFPRSKRGCWKRLMNNEMEIGKQIGRAFYKIRRYFTSSIASVFRSLERQSIEYQQPHVKIFFLEIWVLTSVHTLRAIFKDLQVPSRRRSRVDGEVQGDILPVRNGTSRSRSYVVRACGKGLPPIRGLANNFVN